MKRITWWPQAFLGITFNWGALAGWAAATGGLAAAGPAALCRGLLLDAGLRHDLRPSGQDRRRPDRRQVDARAGSAPPPRCWLWGFYGITLALLAAAGWSAGQGPGFYLAADRGRRRFRLADRGPSTSTTRPSCLRALPRQPRASGSSVCLALAPRQGLGLDGQPVRLGQPRRSRPACRRRPGCSAASRSSSTARSTGISASRSPACAAAARPCSSPCLGAPSAATAAGCPSWRRCRRAGYLGARLLPPQPGDLPAFPFEAVARRAGRARAATGRAPTERLSALRLQLRLIAPGACSCAGSASAALLTLEIIDYPGEWLLDLPLLDQSYEAWSAATLRAAEAPPRAAARQGLASFAAGLDLDGAGRTRPGGRRLAALYTDYLHRCQHEPGSACVQPGRFTMPGRPRRQRAAASSARCRPQAAPGAACRTLMRAPLRALPERGRPALLSRSFQPLRSPDRAGRPARHASIAARPASPTPRRRWRWCCAISATARAACSRVCCGRASRPCCSRSARPITSPTTSITTCSLLLELHGRPMPPARRASRASSRPSWRSPPCARPTSCAPSITARCCPASQGVVKGEERATVLFPGEIPPDLPAEEDWRAAAASGFATSRPGA